MRNDILKLDKKKVIKLQQFIKNFSLFFHFLMKYGAYI